MMHRCVYNRFSHFSSFLLRQSIHQIAVHKKGSDFHLQLLIDAISLHLSFSQLHLLLYYEFLLQQTQSSNIHKTNHLHSIVLSLIASLHNTLIKSLLFSTSGILYPSISLFFHFIRQSSLMQPYFQNIFSNSVLHLQMSFMTDPINTYAYHTHNNCYRKYFFKFTLRSQTSFMINPVMINDNLYLR